MRPLTIKQLEILSEIHYNANIFQISGFTNQRDVGKLRNWKRFDSSVIEEVENKFGDIAKIGEEISSLVCILKDIR